MNITKDLKRFKLRINCISAYLVAYKLTNNLINKKWEDLNTLD